jgi:hypothetical protein
MWDQIFYNILIVIIVITLTEFESNSVTLSKVEIQLFVIARIFFLLGAIKTIF